MSEEKKTPETSIDLDAFAKEAAEKAVAQYAMKQAEEESSKRKSRS